MTVQKPYVTAYGHISIMIVSSKCALYRCHTSTGSHSRRWVEFLWSIWRSRRMSQSQEAATDELATEHSEVSSNLFLTATGTRTTKGNVGPLDWRSGWLLSTCWPWLYHITEEQRTRINVHQLLNVSRWASSSSCSVITWRRLGEWLRSIPGAQAVGERKFKNKFGNTDFLNRMTRKPTRPGHSWSPGRIWRELCRPRSEFVCPIWSEALSPWLLGRFGELAFNRNELGIKFGLEVYGASGHITNDKDLTVSSSISHWSSW